MLTLVKRSPDFIVLSDVGLWWYNCCLKPINVFKEGGADIEMPYLAGRQLCYAKFYVTNC